MRHLLGVAVVVFLGFLAWQVGDRLSTDAVSMAVGLGLRRDGRCAVGAADHDDTPPPAG